MRTNDWIYIDVVKDIDGFRSGSASPGRDKYHKASSHIWLLPQFKQPRDANEIIISTTGPKIYQYQEGSTPDTKHMMINDNKNIYLCLP